MIQIYKYGQVADEDIFARVVPAVNVEAIVTQIIDALTTKFIGNNDKGVCEFQQLHQSADVFQITTGQTLRVYDLDGLVLR